LEEDRKDNILSEEDDDDQMEDINDDEFTLISVQHNTKSMRNQK
jgi:hypothetical protein